MANKRAGCAQDRFFSVEPIQTTKNSAGGRLKAFLEKMEKGEHPDFLAVMAALSDCVAFSADCDLFPEGPPKSIGEMSQKKCRFCD